MQYILKKLLYESKKYKIPKCELDGIYYHGTVIQKDENIFTPNFEYSDYGALWCCQDENISEKFGDSWFNNDGDIKVIYQLEVKSKKIADISSGYEELKEYLCEIDLRDCIPYLKQQGFDGWVTIGSIGDEIYDDIALFNIDIFKVLNVKVFINNEWSDYMSLNDAQNLIDIL